MFRPILLSLRPVLRPVTLLAVCLTLLSAPTFADCQSEGLKLDHAQLRATLPNAPVSAGYLYITNTTGQSQTLLSVAAPFAQRAEIHDMKHDAGVMKMYEIKGGVAVADGFTVALMPKGRHLMFMGLERQLKEDGNLYRLIFYYQNGLKHIGQGMLKDVNKQTLKQILWIGE